MKLLEAVTATLFPLQHQRMLLKNQDQRQGNMDTTPNVSTTTVGPYCDILTEKVAIDCEMMQANIGQVLGRVSVVNYESRTIFDTFVCYPEPVHIINTYEKFSRIGWSDINS